MTQSGYIDFSLLKKRVSIVDVLKAYDLYADLKKSGDQLRGICPIHEGSDKREFIVTPSKNEWYCHGDCKEGGDILSLISKVDQCSVKEAALDIASKFSFNGTPKNGKRPTQPKSKPEKSPQSNGEGLQPLSYLESDHSLLEEQGLLSDTCEHFGAGYAPKGIMRGRLAIPLHDLDGRLLAYCGRAVKNGQTPRLTVPKGFDATSVLFNAHRIEETDSITIARDPLLVLQAFEQGIENVVGIIGGAVTVPQLEMLVDFMNSNGIMYLEVDNIDIED
jgi:DNA primase